jgi:uncharacterized protein (TIGR00369 family)
MADFQVRDPDYEARIRESFSRQVFMDTLGAMLLAVEPGRVDIGMPFDPALTQQDGYLHAGAISAIADSACGYAALTLSAPGQEVLAVEFKVNLLSPGVGERFRASGTVLRPGRTITVCRAEVFAEQDDDEKRIAAMQGTMYLG